MIFKFKSLRSRYAALGSPLIRASYASPAYTAGTTTRDMPVRHPYFSIRIWHITTTTHHLCVNMKHA